MKNMQKLIFISGTGRSGTHLIGRTLSSHPEIEGRIEDPKTFRLITKIATTQDFKNPFYNTILKLILYFRLRNVLKRSSHHILEKSHPSLWLIEYFISKFDNSYFVGVLREPEPTISSMLEHQGVLSWYKKLPQNKRNQFLGITKSNKNEFAHYSLEEKCALRWLSHRNALYRLKDKYPSRIFILNYENFLKSPAQPLSDISSFLEVPNDFKPEEFKFDSLNKWKEKLSKEQIKKINKIINKYRATSV